MAFAESDAADSQVNVRLWFISNPQWPEWGQSESRSLNCRNVLSIWSGYGGFQVSTISARTRCGRPSRVALERTAASDNPMSRAIAWWCWCASHRWISSSSISGLQPASIDRPARPHPRLLPSRLCQCRMKPAAARPNTIRASPVNKPICCAFARICPGMRSRSSAIRPIESMPQRSARQRFSSLVQRRTVPSTIKARTAAWRGASRHRATGRRCPMMCPLAHPPPRCSPGRAPPATRHIAERLKRSGRSGRA